MLKPRARGGREGESHDDSKMISGIISLGDNCFFLSVNKAGDEKGASISAQEQQST